MEFRMAWMKKKLPWIKLAVRIRQLRKAIWDRMLELVKPFTETPKTGSGGILGGSTEKAAPDANAKD